MSLKEGTAVWVPDPEHVWLPAKVDVKISNGLIRQMRTLATAVDALCNVVTCKRSNCCFCCFKYNRVSAQHRKTSIRHVAKCVY